MNFTQKVVSTIQNRKSALCVGLDFDIAKIPAILKNEKNPIEKFNKEIISATQEFVAAFKPNLAFYEVFGSQGIDGFAKSLEFIDSEVVVIADAKRGDIGNTSHKYAKAFLENFNCDAITVSPYMGEDSIRPFLDDETKGVFVLALTSNKGSQDFQMQKMANGQYLYETVIERVSKWNEKQNIGLVVGATHPSMFEGIRKLAPKMPYLIPGIGAQGGDLENTIKYGFVKDEVSALINSSRGIIYASNGSDFAEAAAKKAKELRDQINSLL